MKTELSGLMRSLMTSTWQLNHFIQGHANYASEGSHQMSQISRLGFVKRDPSGEENGMPIYVFNVLRN